MPRVTIQLGEWSPDAGEHGNAGLLTAKNAIPYSSGYVPQSPYSAMSSALSGAPTLGSGLHVNRESGSAGWLIYYGHGSGTDLYVVDPSTTVSTAVSGASAPWTMDTYKWQFCSFGSHVIALPGTTDVAQIRLSGAGNFQDLFTSTWKPRPRFAASIFGRVAYANAGNLSGLSPAGYDPDPYLVFWSATDNARDVGKPGDATYAAADAAGAADVQTIYDGHGGITGLAAGGLDWGVVFKAGATYLIRFGDPFLGASIEILSATVGCPWPNTIVTVNDEVFFLDQLGVPSSVNPSGVREVGKGRLSRTVGSTGWVASDPNMGFGTFQSAAPYSPHAAYDVRTDTTYFWYRNQLGEQRALAYNHSVDAFSALEEDAVSVGGVNYGTLVWGSAASPSLGRAFSVPGDVIFGVSTSLENRIYWGEDGGDWVRLAAIGWGTGAVRLDSNSQAVIRGVRPVYSLRTDAAASPVWRVSVFGRNLPEGPEASSVVLSSDAGQPDELGFLRFPATQASQYHRVLVEALATPGDGHPSAAVAEIQAIEVEYDLAARHGSRQ